MNLKNVNFLPLILLFTGTIIAQNNQRTLAPISGHYKELAKLNTKPLPDSTDRKQFPLEGLSPKNALKLLLKPEYLIIPASDFRVIDFPANSSAQTKAEIEFLLKLQKEARSEEKVKESLEFANVYYNVFVKASDVDYPKMQKNLFHTGRQIEGFSPENLPITAKLMTKVWSDLTYYFWALKFKFNRTRPYMIDSRIKNLDNTNFQALSVWPCFCLLCRSIYLPRTFPRKERINLKKCLRYGLFKRNIRSSFSV